MGSSRELFQALLSWVLLLCSHILSQGFCSLLARPYQLIDLWIWIHPRTQRKVETANDAQCCIRQKTSLVKARGGSPKPAVSGAPSREGPSAWILHRLAAPNLSKADRQPLWRPKQRTGLTSEGCAAQSVSPGATRTGLVRSYVNSRGPLIVPSCRAMSGNAGS